MIERIAPAASSRGAAEERDELGLPTEGDPADFACAFSALRAAILVLDLPARRPGRLGDRLN